MKKFATVLGVLLLGVSAMGFAGCDETDVQPENPVHEHTFATEWSKDETYHWYASTCEHKDEVKDKAEHTYGADGNCTVCSQAKPVVSTATQEQWSGSIEAMSTMTNMRVFADITGASTGTATIEIDGDKMRLITVNDTSYDEEIVVKVEGNSYDSYSRTSETGSYTEAKNADIRNFTGTLDGFVGIAQVAKDKFSDATYDETTKIYTLNVGNATVTGIGEVSGMVCQFAFANGTLKEVNIVLTIVARNLHYDMDFEFGGVEITVPQA